jgi:hypothetical protein
MQTVKKTGANWTNQAGLGRDARMRGPRDGTVFEVLNANWTRKLLKTDFNDKIISVRCGHT